MNQLQSIARRLLSARGFFPEFSEAARAQANAAVVPRFSTEIRDLRQLLWSSIDNDSSRDLDQLTVAESLPNGAVKVLLAIADVDALVPAGTAIDLHAQNNTVTVYTAAGVFPMLPERLSTDLSSLNEGADRQAIVIEMEVAADGSVGQSDVYRAWVRSSAKLAYRSVAAWLDGAGPAPSKVAAIAGLAEQLRLQDVTAQRLRQLRFARGALSLQTERTEAVFKGTALVDLEPDAGNRAKELIEEFMVAGNVVVARFLTTKQFPSLRRALRAPERWARIQELARELGESLPAEPDGAALSQFLERQHRVAPDHFADLSLSIVKLLGRGQYVVLLPGRESVGHFGLGAEDYSHSTAPNRRLADLLTQRLLKAAMHSAAVPYTDEQLLAFAEHCNAQEANAAKVERQVAKSAAAGLLSSRIGDRFDGIVTGASAKGTWVRIHGPTTEGKIIRGADGLDVGARVQVELLRVDVEQGFIDFARASS